MKKLKLAFLFVLISFASVAQNWKPVDMKKTINEPKIAVTKDGILYIAGKKHGATSSVILSKFDGKTLSTIYTPDFTKPHPDVSIGIGANNLPIVAYTESGVAMVKQFDGKTLVDVSSESPAPKGYNYFKMLTDNNGTPYVFYMAGGFFYIKKLENGVWTQLVEAKGTGDYRVAFDSKNVPYVAFKDKRFVKKYEDESLVDIGPSYYLKSTSEFGLAIDKNDTVYMSYSAFENGVLQLAKFNGTSWETLPEPTSDLPGKMGELPTIAFDSNNNMYFTCSFRSIGITAIKKFVNGSWVDFRQGIDDEDIKVYSVGKEFAMSDNGILYLSRPFFFIKLN